MTELKKEKSAQLLEAADALSRSFRDIPYDRSNAYLTMQTAYERYENLKSELDAGVVKGDDKMPSKMRMIPIASCETCPNKVWDFDNYACKAFADKAITERGVSKLDPRYLPRWCPLPAIPIED